MRPAFKTTMKHYADMVKIEDEVTRLLGMAMWPVISLPNHKGQKSEAVHVNQEPQPEPIQEQAKRKRLTGQIQEVFAAYRRV